MGNNGTAPLINCTVNSVTVYFTDLISDREIMNKIHYSYQTVLKDVIYLHDPKFIWRNASVVVKMFCKLCADKSSVSIHPCPFWIIPVLGRNDKLLILSVSRESQVPPLV